MVKFVLHNFTLSYLFILMVDFSFVSSDHIFWITSEQNCIPFSYDFQYCIRGHAEIPEYSPIHAQEFPGKCHWLQAWGQWTRRSIHWIYSSRLRMKHMYSLGEGDSFFFSLSIAGLLRLTCKAEIGGKSCNLLCQTPGMRHDHKGAISLLCYYLLKDRLLGKDKVKLPLFHFMEQRRIVHYMNSLPIRFQNRILAGLSFIVDSIYYSCRLIRVLCFKSISPFCLQSEGKTFNKVYSTHH